MIAEIKVFKVTNTVWDREKWVTEKNEQKKIFKFFKVCSRSSYFELFFPLYRCISLLFWMCFLILVFGKFFNSILSIPFLECAKTEYDFKNITRTFIPIRNWIIRKTFKIVSKLVEIYYWFLETTSFWQLSWPKLDTIKKVFNLRKFWIYLKQFLITLFWIYLVLKIKKKL